MYTSYLSRSLGFRITEGCRSRITLVSFTKVTITNTFPLTVIFSMSRMMGLLETYPYYTLAALFFGCMFVIQLKKGKSRNPNGLPLPPGPKGYPLIGSFFDFPINNPWLLYEEWCKTYGKCSGINQPFVANTT
jgi:hypothetical protein